MSSGLSPAAAAPRRRRLGVLLVLLSALGWSTAGLFTKGVEADGWTVLFWRSLFAAPPLLAYALRRAAGGGGAAFRRLGWPGWTTALVASAATVCFLQAFKLTSVAKVTLIYATAPFLAAALAWLLFRERPRRRTLLASLGALAGVLTMLGGTLRSGTMAGDGLALAMTLCMALYLVMLRRFAERPMLLAAALSSLQIALIAWIVAPSLMAPAGELALLALFGLLQALAVIALTAGAARLAAADSALLSALETPLAPLWAWLLLAERPAAATLLGGALILVALFWSLRPPGASMAPPRGRTAHARTAPLLRMLRHGPAAREPGSAHLFLRVHLLPRLRRRGAGRALPELRRRDGPPAGASGGATADPPGLHPAQGEAGGLRRRRRRRAMSGEPVIAGWHAHIYYDDESVEAAAALREAAGQRFAVELGRLHRKPVGPHPRWSCQLAFAPEVFPQIVPWLALNRGELVIFLHPETGQAVEDHRDRALWMGTGLELNLAVLPT